MNLLRFRKDDVVLPTRLLVVGRTNSGKSHYLRYLLYYWCDQIDKLYIVSPTQKPGEYAELSHSEHIIRRFTPEFLEDIIEEQETHLKNGEKLPAVFIFIDDSIHDMRKTDKIFSSLYSQGRHLNISVAFITQKFRAVNGIVRDNSDYVIVAHVANHKEKEALYDEYGFDEKKGDFFKLIANATVNHGMLVINTTERRVTRMFTVDKAPETIPRFYVEACMRPKEARAQAVAAAKKPVSTTVDPDSS